MPVYKYTATNIDGRKARGREIAPDVEQLAERLRGKDLVLLEYEQLADNAKTVKLKLPVVADFSRQLGALLKAGVPLIRAMTIIAQRDAKPQIKAMYNELIKALQQGAPLSDALAMQGNAFPELMINMYRAAENSGNLDATAQRMAEHYEKEHRLQAKVKSASTYPIMLLVLTVVIMVIMFTFVIPKFMPMFEGMELPWATKAALAISNALTQHWITILIVVMIAILAVGMVVQQPKVKRALDHLKLHIPATGKLMRTIYTARFARTLSSLYVSGIAMIQALNITRGTVGNTYIEAQIPDAINELANGRTLSQAISRIDGFDPKLVSTVLVGEESGQLEHMLVSMADNYDYEAGEASQRLVTLVEPVMICVMALLVVFVMMAVLMPIFGLYGNIG